MLRLEWGTALEGSSSSTLVRAARCQRAATFPGIFSAPQSLFLKFHVLLALLGGRGTRMSSLAWGRGELLTPTASDHDAPLLVAITEQYDDYYIMQAGSAGAAGQIAEGGGGGRCCL